MINPIIDEYGNHRWYNSSNELHRDDGPAFIGADGTYSIWFVNGLRHREDGPAFVEATRRHVWWLNGYTIHSAKEFQKTANLTDEDMTALILKYGNID